MAFHDRIGAGRRPAAVLARLRDQNVVVPGLPRGGVPVTTEVARALPAPRDVIVVRKVGVPWQPELALGAVGEAGAGVVRLAGIEPEWCLLRPKYFGPVSTFYDDLSPTTHREASALLDQAAAARQAIADPPGPEPETDAANVTVDAGATRLVGRLTIPQDASFESDAKARGPGGS